MDSQLSAHSFVDTISNASTLVNQVTNFSTVEDNTSIGSNFNGWRIPVQTFSSQEPNLEEQFRENEHTSNYVMSSATWRKSCGMVDNAMQVIHQTLMKVASKRFPCLRFGEFVKQGSSREGLKIRKPDEFDMVLPFTIEGVDIQSVPALDSNGELIPAYVTLKISEDQLEKLNSGKEYESLRRTSVFEQRGSSLYLNAKNFQTQVISSIMDSTIACIQTDINAETEDQPCSFTFIKASVFPPTYRFIMKIENNAGFNVLEFGKNMFERLGDVPCAHMKWTPIWSPTNKIIAFDIVPGILLKPDQVMNPDSSIQMTCDRYAVMKWIHRERHAANYHDPELMWKESTCGYEKLIIDIGLRDQSGRYILTACRIMKAYLDSLDRSSQLRSLLTSYRIKNIAIHSLIFQLRVSGVKDALGYLIKFLETSINKQFLPHFFYGNKHIKSIAPTISESEQKRLNLFEDIRTGHFVQATKALESMKADLRDSFIDVDLDDEHVAAFRELCKQNRQIFLSICLIILLFSIFAELLALVYDLK